MNRWEKGLPCLSSSPSEIIHTPITSSPEPNGTSHLSPSLLARVLVRAVIEMGASHRGRAPYFESKEIRQDGLSKSTDTFDWRHSATDSYAGLL